MYVAKPYMNNKIGMKRFPTKEEAVEYLEEYTGISMGYVKKKKTKKRKTEEVIYDWELIDKLYLEETGA